MVCDRNNSIDELYSPSPYIGSAISWDGHFNTQIEDEVFSSVIDLVLNCGTFIYIGAWMPFNMFNAPELSITPWRLVVVFVAVLFLRRIPPLLLLYKWVPEIATWREALFSGHFGKLFLLCMRSSVADLHLHRSCKIIA